MSAASATCASAALDLRLELLLLDVERRQHRLLLVELGLVQPPLGDGPLGVVVGLLDQLLRAGDSGPQQVALALVLELVAQHVGLGGVDRRLGLPDQRVLHVRWLARLASVACAAARLALARSSWAW